MFLESIWIALHVQFTLIALLFFPNFLVVQVEFSAFSPHHSLIPSAPHLCPIFTPPLLPMYPLQLFLQTLHPFPLKFPPLSPLVTVGLFSISVSLVIFYSFVCFVDYIPVKGEIIRCLSFIPWLTSLSIVLSSSIPAVANGRSLFFLSAAQYSVV